MTKEIFELLARCETEMRYAGWINPDPEADNPQRRELYIAVCEALAQPAPLPVQEPLTDERISLIAHTLDEGDWNDLAYQDCWHKGFKAGFRESEKEHGIKEKCNG